MNVKERKHYGRHKRKPVLQRKRLARREKIQKQARRQRRLAAIRSICVKTKAAITLNAVSR